MLPFEWEEEDKENVKFYDGKVLLHGADEIGLDSPRDLKEYEGDYFVSEMMYHWPVSKIKELVFELFKKFEEAIKNDNSNPQMFDAFLGHCMSFDVFDIEEFIEHPSMGHIFVKINSPLFDSAHEPVPLITGIIMENGPKIAELRKKGLEVSEYINDLFLKGFGKKLNFSKENINFFYKDELENAEEPKDWDSLLTDYDKQFLKDFRIKSSRNK